MLVLRILSSVLRGACSVLSSLYHEFAKALAVSSFVSSPLKHVSASLISGDVAALVAPRSASLMMYGNVCDARAIVDVRGVCAGILHTP